MPLLDIALDVTTLAASLLSDETAAEMVQTLEIADLLGNNDPNVIRNPCGLVAQRGTSFTDPASGAYTLDGWKQNYSDDAAVDIKQSTVVPTVAEAGYRIPSSIHLDVTTADASIGAGQWRVLRHVVEGYLWSSVAQQGGTLSFWVRSPKTGTHAVMLANTAVDRLLLLEYTVDVADTYQLITLSVPASPSGGTWDYTTGAGVYIDWTLACGTDFDDAANGSWITPAFIEWGTTASQPTNILDSASNDFYLTDVRLVPGTHGLLTPPRDFISDYRLCERYFQKTFEYATAPAFGAGWEGSLVVCGPSTDADAVNWIYSVPMRTDGGTLALYNPKPGGTADGRFANGAGEASTTAAVLYDDAHKAQIHTQVALTTRHYIHATVSHEL